MVRAGPVPLDRAHAHARWAERYDAQSDPHRAAAHFGRAMHYAQMAQAFGAPKSAREKGSRDIVVGRWEDGAEVWSTLQHLTYPARMAAATKKRRVHEALHGQGGASSRKPLYAGPVGPAGPAGYDYRELPDMLDEMYASESSGIMGSVHPDPRGLWHLHRCELTGIVYLVPGRLATDAHGVRDLVEGVARYQAAAPAYTGALEDGLLIVQDQRPARVQVKRYGVWEPATEIETFAYYDFLVRYPARVHNYVGEKAASEMHASLVGEQNNFREWLLSVSTPIPAHLQDEENGNLDIAIKRDRSGIYVGNNGGFGSNRRQISDVAWRLPRQAS